MGPGIGGGQHTGEGGADEGTVTGAQVGGEEQPESCDAGHDGSDERVIGDERPPGPTWMTGMAVGNERLEVRVRIDHGGESTSAARV